MNMMFKASLFAMFAMIVINNPAMSQNSGNIPEVPGDMPVDVQETTTTTRTTSSSSSDSVSTSTSSTNSSGTANTSSSSSTSSTEIINPDIRSKPSANRQGTEFSITRKFVPKFKERLTDLADQIKMAQGKGWINAEESSKFMERQSRLLTEEAEANKAGYPKSSVDNLEREITLLNGELFKAMHKTDPIKPGQAEKEVNDPNLIPAYPDPELQPNRGNK